MIVALATSGPSDKQTRMMVQVQERRREDVVGGPAQIGREVERGREIAEQHNARVREACTKRILPRGSASRG